MEKFGEVWEAMYEHPKPSIALHKDPEVTMLKKRNWMLMSQLTEMERMQRNLTAKMIQYARLLASPPLQVQSSRMGAYRGSCQPPTPGYCGTGMNPPILLCSLANAESFHDSGDATGAPTDASNPEASAAGIPSASTEARHSGFARSRSGTK